MHRAWARGRSLTTFEDRCNVIWNPQKHLEQGFKFKSFVWMRSQESPLGDREGGEPTAGVPGAALSLCDPAGPLSLSEAEFAFLQNREICPSLPGGKGREVSRDRGRSHPDSQPKLWETEQAPARTLWG